jgi:hypothetical protein
MTKIPGSGHHHLRLPPQPKGPHKTHETKRKGNTAQTADPQAIDVEIPVDSLDRSRAIGETSSGGQGGFGERAPHDPKAAVGEEPLQERRALDVIDSLAVLIDEIKVRLSRLAEPTEKTQDATGLADPTRAAPRSIPRAETVNELRDLLRQALAGDFGFTLASTPQITFDALFGRVPSWPSDVPRDLDALLAWVMCPPPMPGDLLKF